jgi:hypothetical protein
MSNELRHLVARCRDEQVSDVATAVAQLHEHFTAADALAGQARLLAISGLAYLARAERAHACMASAPLLDALARALLHGVPTAAREWAAMCLRYLSRTPSTRALMRACGVDLLEPLARALESSASDEKTRSWAISALAYQLRDGECRQRLVTPHADEHRAHFGSALGRAVSSAIVRAMRGDLSHRQRERQRAARADVGGDADEAADADDGLGWELRVWAAEACASLALFEPGRALLRADGAVAAALELSCSVDAPASGRRSCLDAVALLSRDSPGREQHGTDGMAEAAEWRAQMQRESTPGSCEPLASRDSAAARAAPESDARPTAPTAKATCGAGMATLDVSTPAPTARSSSSADGCATRSPHWATGGLARARADLVATPRAFVDGGGESDEGEGRNRALEGEGVSVASACSARSATAASRLPSPQPLPFALRLENEWAPNAEGSPRFAAGSPRQHDQHRHDRMHSERAHGDDGRPADGLALAAREARVEASGLGPTGAAAAPLPMTPRAEHGPLEPPASSSRISPATACALRAQLADARAALVRSDAVVSSLGARLGAAERARDAGAMEVTALRHALAERASEASLARAHDAAGSSETLARADAESDQLYTQLARSEAALAAAREQLDAARADAAASSARACDAERAARLAQAACGEQRDAAAGALREREESEEAARAQLGAQVAALRAQLADESDARDDAVRELDDARHALAREAAAAACAAEGERAARAQLADARACATDDARSRTVCERTAAEVRAAVARAEADTHAARKDAADARATLAVVRTELHAAQAAAADARAALIAAEADARAALAAAADARSAMTTTAIAHSTELGEARLATDAAEMAGRAARAEADARLAAQLARERDDANALAVARADARAARTAATDARAALIAAEADARSALAAAADARSALTASEADARAALAAAADARSAMGAAAAAHSADLGEARRATDAAEMAARAARAEAAALDARLAAQLARERDDANALAVARAELVGADERAHDVQRMRAALEAARVERARADTLSEQEAVRARRELCATRAAAAADVCALVAALREADSVATACGKAELQRAVEVRALALGCSLALAIVLLPACLTSTYRRARVLLLLGCPRRPSLPCLPPPPRVHPLAPARLAHVCTRALRVRV